jgi:glyceraldehyde-3-phosphate dehydrogenase/erythrose-4-phosphate dehydrogenase
MNIHYNFDIMEEYMAIVHTTTATQNIWDDPSGKLWDNGSGSAQKIIPVSTDTANLWARPSQN